VWFLKTPVGKNTLSKISKELIEGAGIKAKGRVFSNKTPRLIGISRMEVAHVPVKKGMRIMGHKYFYFCFCFLGLVCLFFICYWFLFCRALVCSGIIRAMPSTVLWTLTLTRKLAKISYLVIVCLLRGRKSCSRTL
jgi:hypothetical protein